MATTKTKNKGGRPLKFQNAEELQAKINDYFEECKNHKREIVTKDGEVIEISDPQVPTIAGLAYHIETDRQTVYNYEQRDEFFDTIKKARDFILFQIENKIINGEGRAAGPIFIAKNYGYADKTEIEHSGDVNIKVEGLKRV